LTLKNIAQSTDAFHILLSFSSAPSLFLNDEEKERLTTLIRFRLPPAPPPRPFDLSLPCVLFFQQTEITLFFSWLKVLKYLQPFFSSSLFCLPPGKASSSLFARTVGRFGAFTLS
jgi:hypothetical protein